MNADSNATGAPERLIENVAELQSEHERTRTRLHEALAREMGLEAWGVLDELSRRNVVAEAHRLCKAIARDPATWWSEQVQPMGDVPELVAKQHGLAVRLEAAGIGTREDAPTQHSHLNKAK